MNVIMVLSSSSRGVRFGDNVTIDSTEIGDNIVESGEEYCEIFTSDAETLGTSDEENAELLQIALRSVYFSH